MTVFAKRVKEARQNLGLSAESLAERVGVSRNTIACYERGSKEPSLATLQKLALASGRPVGWFFSLDGDLEVGESKEKNFEELSAKPNSKQSKERLDRMEAKMDELKGLMEAIATKIDLWGPPLPREQAELVLGKDALGRTPPESRGQEAKAARSKK